MYERAQAPESDVQALGSSHQRINGKGINSMHGVSVCHEHANLFSVQEPCPRLLIQYLALDYVITSHYPAICLAACSNTRNRVHMHIRIRVVMNTYAVKASRYRPVQLNSSA